MSGFFFQSIVIVTLEKMFGERLQWTLVCAMPESGASGKFLTVSELFQVIYVFYFTAKDERFAKYKYK